MDYGPWQPCWISNQHQKHKSGRGSSSEHFWQVWLISVQRFQRRRFKCEKLTDGRTNRFEPNLAEMFIGWSYTRFLFLVLIGNPTWLPGSIKDENVKFP
jgi:hypothetical protein